MRWRFYLLHPMTGQRGVEVKPAANSSWGIPLNGIEDLAVTVTKSDLAQIEASWWSPRSGGLLMTVETDDGEHPVAAGPFMDVPTETQDTATLSASGIGALLEGRVVLDQDYAPTGSTPTPAQMTALAKSKVALTGRSLGTIMQDVVTYATEKKVGGQLPITFGTPREQHSSYNERTYEGFNLANNEAWKRLTELSEVNNGPDFMFRPEWADADHTHIRWVLYTGTRSQPGIAQDWTMDIDTTAPRSVASNVTVKGDATTYANRVYWTGAGEGAGVIVRAAQDLSELADYTPLVEAVGSTSDSENPDLILTHARAALAAGAQPTVQVSLAVDASDPRSLIGRWHVGDLARVTVRGWLNLPDGTHQMRIISAKGTAGSPIVNLEFQPEVVPWLGDAT